MSSNTGITGLERTVELTNIWLNEIDHELGLQDRQRAYHALRAVLHALRDRLTVQEASDLAAQLPTLIRGIYYEGWKPSQTPNTVRKREQFLDLVASHLAFDIPDINCEQLAKAVFRVIEMHVDRGEIEHVKHMLPKSVRAIWE